MKKSKMKARACDGWRFFNTVFWFANTIQKIQYRWWKEHFFIYFEATSWKVFLTFKGNAQWKIQQYINCTVLLGTFTAMFSEGKSYRAVPLIVSIAQVWLNICYYSCCYYLPRPFILPLPIHFQLFFFHHSGIYIYD